jgi:hypothetical protein
MGYEKQSFKFDNGSADVGQSSARFDFNVLSLSHKAYIRLGGAFGFGSGGSATLAGMTKNDAGGGGAYAGALFTYFVNWHLGLHAMVGPAVGFTSLPDASFSGTGVTFRIAATYQFGDVRTDVKHLEALDDATDITGVLERGAQKLGCHTSQQTRSTYAYLDATCDGRELVFFQIAEGIQVTCNDSFEDECNARIKAIIAAAKAPEPTATPPSQPAAAPAPPPTPTPAPAPTTEPPTAPAATESAPAATESAPVTP